MMLVEFLGIDHEIKGSYTYIKCPGHLKRVGKVDNNFGNCILTEKGYHCFACKGGTTVGLIDMVQELQDCEHLISTYKQSVQGQVFAKTCPYYIYTG